MGAYCPGVADGAYPAAWAFSNKALGAHGSWAHRVEMDAATEEEEAEEDDEDWEVAVRSCGPEPPPLRPNNDFKMLVGAGRAVAAAVEVAAVGACALNAGIMGAEAAALPLVETATSLLKECGGGKTYNKLSVKM
jgi:hypothetical protein